MDVEEILKNIGREGDRVAKWWKAVSRIVRQYIVPYIVELEEKVDDNYFKMIEEEKISTIDTHYLDECNIAFLSFQEMF